MTAERTGDAGALAVGLRREVTGLGLQALAAKALHVAVPRRSGSIDIYDNAAAAGCRAGVPRRACAATSRCRSRRASGRRSGSW
jgi:hypothetical protein